MALRRESDFQRLEERLREAERRVRATTFDEYVKACHEHISKRFSIQTTESLATTGALTSVTGKVCPGKLRRWETFYDAQASCLSHARKLFHADDGPRARRFATVQHLKELGDDLCQRKYASESDLAIYERLAVEGPTAKIMEQLSQLTELDGLVFDNHANSLNDQGEEALERDVTEELQSLAIQEHTTTHEASAVLKGGRPDQYCIYKAAGSHKLLLVAEYKAAHKLSVADLQRRLRPMDLISDVINIAKWETKQDECDHKADWRIGSAVTQAFSYMIENGLEYSYITTGAALVFLWVQANDPATVYYHLAVPSEDVDQNCFDWQRTSIAQVLGLCLMAFRSKQSTERDQAWRDKTINELDIWERNVDLSSQSDEDEKKTETPCSLFKVKGGFKIMKDPERTPIKLRLRPRERCAPASVVDPNPDESSSDNPSESERQMKDQSRDHTQQPRHQPKEQDQLPRNEDHGQGKHHTRQYCTQKCLRGIRHHSALDELCPNVSQHRRKGCHHTVSLQQFTARVKAQLNRTLDRDCEPLGQQGARGALFRIRLASHGYVFVAKGTIRAFVPDLLHEGKVYQQLQHLQGHAVPVHLGNIDLAKRYRLDVGVHIVHMLLMSWGGETVGVDDETAHDRPGFSEKLRCTVAGVARAGIDQADLRMPNVLWNRELDCPMLIDFERAVFLRHSRSRSKGGRAVLREVSFNEQAVDDGGEKKGRKRVRGGGWGGGVEME